MESLSAFLCFIPFRARVTPTQRERRKNQGTNIPANHKVNERAAGGIQRIQPDTKQSWKPAQAASVHQEKASWELPEGFQSTLGNINCPFKQLCRGQGWRLNIMTTFGNKGTGKAELAPRCGTGQGGGESKGFLQTLSDPSGIWTPCRWLGLVLVTQLGHGGTGCSGRKRFPDPESGKTALEMDSFCVIFLSSSPASCCSLRNSLFLHDLG